MTVPDTQQHEWQAAWIWPQEHAWTVNFHCLARKTFALKGDIRHVVLRISAYSDYRLWVNGRYVARGPTPIDPWFQSYDTHDFTALLQPGVNVIAIVVHNYAIGWHGQHKGHIECDDAFRLTVNDQLVAEQNYDEEFARSRTWRGKDEYDQVHYGVGPVGFRRAVTLQAGWNMVFVAVDHGPAGWGFTLAWLEPQGDAPVALPFAADGAEGRWLIAGPFASSGMNDSLDDAATKITQLPPAMRQFYDPFDYSGVTDYATLMRYETRGAPVAATPGEPLTLHAGEYCIFDLGKVRVGYPELRVTADAAATLDIGYSQLLPANRAINFSSSGRTKYVDRVYLAAGTQTWQPLHRRTGRYIHVSCRAGNDVIVMCPSMHQVGYPVEEVGAFACSDEVLNDIWRTSVYTTALVMQDGYQDCLKREEGTFNTSSFNYASRAAACAFGDYALARKTLRLAAQLQNESGWFDSHGLSGLNEDEISECLLWAVWLRDWYMYSGDKAFLGEIFETLEDNLRFFAKSINRYSLLDGGNWHLLRRGQSIYLDDVISFINPSTMRTYRGDYPGELSGFNILYYAALRAAAFLATELGQAERAEYYERRAARVKRALNERLWDDAHQHYADDRTGDQISPNGHPIIQIAAVYYGVSDGARTEQVMRGLVDDMGLPREDKPDYPLVTFGYYYYFLSVLFRHGHTDVAFELLRRYHGRWLAAGATTFGEHFKLADLRGKTTLEQEYEVHAYGTSAHLHFYTHILGVQPSAPGFAAVRVAPHPGDLRCASGAAATLHGPIQIDWKIQDVTFQLDLVVPAGITCECEAPRGFTDCHIRINGEDVEPRTYV